MTWKDILKSADNIYDTSDPLYNSEMEKRIKELSQYFDEDIERHELASELEKKYGVRRIIQIKDRDFRKEMKKLMDDAPNSHYLDDFFFREIKRDDWLQWLAGEIDLWFSLKDAYKEMAEEERRKINMR